MSPRLSFALLFFAACVAALPAGCDRELRKLSKPDKGGPVPAAAPPQGMQPGQAGDGLTTTSAARTFDPENAYELNQGKRLFAWYNCAACHALGGGGGMGPPLMDEKWIYGSDPETIFQTIMGGRPNGMPSFRGRIPEDQVWQLVAYVRSLSGQSSKSASPSRSDGISAVPPENERKRMEPQTTGPQPPMNKP